MLTETDLQELLSYEGKHPVLSVYLNTDPTNGNTDAYKLNLRSMLKDVNLAEDIATVENYFNLEYDWSGRSVAVFSCATEKFFRAFPLAMPVRNRVRISNHPHVKPLADLLDNFGGYGVVLVDKQGARLFYFHLGDLREQEGFLGESVRHTKRGGASSFPGRRGGVAGRTNYNEEVIDRNMREVVDLASHFFTENNVRRIIIGGTDDNVALFRSLLPKSWQSLVVGSFPMSMTANAHDVWERVMEVGKEAEYRQETQLLSTMITSAAKGRGGILGLDDTLSAVHAGRVQTLIIRDGYRAPGYRCQGCNYLTTQHIETCPFCGNTFAHIPDAAELTVWKVMQNGGEVEVIPQDRRVSGFENIGAILRY